MKTVLGGRSQTARRTVRMALRAKARELARRVLATQCLDRRIPDKSALIAQVTAWQDNRNKHHVKANWQFTTSDTRIKLKSLYPQFE